MVVHAGDGGFQLVRAASGHSTASQTSHSLGHGTAINGKWSGWSIKGGKHPGGWWEVGREAGNGSL